MNYKQEMMFPIILLVLSVVLLVFQITTTGLKLDIDLKGGTQIIGELPNAVSEADLEKVLTPYGASIRTSTSLSGTSSVFIGVDSAVNTTDLISDLAKNGYTLNNYSIQTVGTSLGASFFQQAIFVLAFAFLFMGITVFIIFRIPLPSFYVVLCGVADITETLVVSQLLGIPLSLATFTSLLLLLGYSVDTDILLTTRVFKTEGGDVAAKVKGAMKTGITMVGATIAALLALYVISTSPVISQIASILLIGLVLDIINTWLLNAPLLRLYMDRKVKQK
jgi:preprotein translocase subunit SecF